MAEQQALSPIAAQALQRARSAREHQSSRKRFWTNHEVELLTKRYPDEPSSVIAECLGRPVAAVQSKAKLLGLKKSEAFMDSPLSGRLDGVRGASTRFQKGMPSWNKGKKFQPDGRSTQTQFKPGNFPHNHVPIGTEVMATDGYLKIKVSEPNKWEWTHRRNWEARHGSIPKGMALVFKTSDRMNCDVDNLELVTRSELMRRNSIQRYPAEINDTIRLLGKLKRTIEAHHE